MAMIEGADTQLNVSSYYMLLHAAGPFQGVYSATQQQHQGLFSCFVGGMLALCLSRYAFEFNYPAPAASGSDRPATPGGRALPYGMVCLHVAHGCPSITFTRGPGPANGILASGRGPRCVFCFR